MKLPGGKGGSFPPLGKKGGSFPVRSDEASLRNVMN